MYLSDRPTPEVQNDADRRRAESRSPRQRVGRTVVLLGLVSLVTDVSSESLSAILPLYVTAVLGMSPLAYGVIDGVYQRVSALVRLAAAAPGGFSTRTVMTRLEDRSSADLETFALLHQGRRITPPDRNFWGVTFADDDGTFYVTVAFGGQTWLARGSLSKLSLVNLRADAECPSLSPDGTKVAYKKRGGRAADGWRLAVLDVATGREVFLTEHRSVDDQVEWLDDEHILYGMPGEDAGGSREQRVGGAGGRHGHAEDPHPQGMVTGGRALTVAAPW